MWAWDVGRGTGSDSDSGSGVRGSARGQGQAACKRSLGLLADYRLCGVVWCNGWKRRWHRRDTGSIPGSTDRPRALGALMVARA